MSLLRATNHFLDFGSERHHSSISQVVSSDDSRISGLSIIMVLNPSSSQFFRRLQTIIRFVTPTWGAARPTHAWSGFFIYFTISVQSFVYFFHSECFIGSHTVLRILLSFQVSIFNTAKSLFLMYRSEYSSI